MNIGPMIKITCLLLLTIVLADAATAASIADNMNTFKEYVMEAPVSQYPFLKLLRVASSDLVQELGALRQEHVA